MRDHFKIKRKIDRAAVAKSLHDLEKLFGKKPPAERDNAAGKSGAGETGKLISEVPNEI